MANSIICHAYAKINLTLDIVGKRMDGYHLLQMVMQSVSLFDTLTVQRTTESGIQLCCNQNEIPCDERNTVFKAAREFYRFCKIEDENIKITIEKQIPSQAGLAGGSADAAAVLHAMNELYQTKLSVFQLCEIGLKVGADVPFCVRGGTLLAEGTGEILTELSPMPNCFIILCKPNVSVNTAEAYAKADSVILREHPNTSAMCQALKENNLNAVCENLKNVFEDVLQIEKIQTLKCKMKSMGAMGTCMTGSGSVVFGIFEDEKTAQMCKQALKQEYEQVFLCSPYKKGISISKNN